MAKLVAEFDIIGRVGKVEALDSVTKLNIATEDHRKVDDEWVTTTYWNKVTLFNHDAKRAANAKTGQIVRVKGTFNQTEYEVDGETRYGYDFKGNMYANYGKPAKDDDQAE